MRAQRGMKMVTGRQFSAVLHRAAASLAVLLLLGCANTLVSTPDPKTLPALPTEAGNYTAELALASVSTPRLLQLNDEMREFVDRYVRHGDQRQRLRILHKSLLSPALVGIEYDPSADGSAADVFASGYANCLSYAHLFIALARYAGLDASYLSVSLRPEWSRHGDQVALRKHVNVFVTLRNGEQYVVDIKPLSREQVASADRLKDREAFALYHGNLAMDALLKRRYDLAYAQALRALELGSRIDYLWTNLGAIYRLAEEDAGAEEAYMTALSINGNSRSAMNNLAVLYSRQGLQDKASYWEQQVQRYRQRNPYYHYYLGDLAQQAGNLDQAIDHVREAIALKDSDAEFYFRLAQLYYAKHEPDRSIPLLEQAIERSRLVGEREQYLQFLKQVNDDTVAVVDYPASTS
ncbi:MAG: transglutaminase domain-containing protein [Halieaceae bacterium]